MNKETELDKICFNKKCKYNIKKVQRYFCDRKEGVFGCMQWFKLICKFTPKKNGIRK